jgi:hypothetical protein
MVLFEEKASGRSRASLAKGRLTNGSCRSKLLPRCTGQAISARIRPGELRAALRSQLLRSTTHFFESVLFVFCFRSFRSLLRPRACLFVTRSSREMKFTGTPKKVLATLFLHASGNSTPVISVRMSMRTGVIPI